jgi:hypothetical protein
MAAETRKGLMVLDELGAQFTFFHFTNMMVNFSNILDQLIAE